MLFKIFKKSPSDIYEKKLNSFLSELNQFEWDDKNTVKSLIRDAIIIDDTKFNKVKIGSSKLGGTPDLPSSITWPKFKNESMQFFGQINLTEISDYHRSELLPKTGILYFFAYFQEPVNEFGAEYDFIKNKKEYSVIYFDGSLDELRSTSFPADIYKDYRFLEKSIAFETIFQLPATEETGIMESSNLSENDRNQIVEFSNMTDDGIFDQILGHPVPIQYGVDYDWALSYLEIDLEKKEQIKRKSEIEKIRPEFINLLTIPLFKPIGGSQVYFGILKKDLKNKNFGKSVFILQDT